MGNNDIIPFAGHVNVSPDTPYNRLSGDEEGNLVIEREIPSVGNECFRKVAHSRLEENSHILYLRNRATSCNEAQFEA